MKKTLVKRRMGRPPTGVRPFLGARFAKEEADGIDRFAKENKCSRSEAIRQLVRYALAELKI
jgi:Ribbon-helix-helix protein, copG family